jgi:transposase
LGSETTCKTLVTLCSKSRKHLSLDETAFFNCNLYTILTKKKAKGKKSALVAMVKGIKADAVIKILHKIPLKQRKKVKEVTLDMAGNMGLIVKNYSLMLH